MSFRSNCPLAARRAWSLMVAAALLTTPAWSADDRGTAAAGAPAASTEGTARTESQREAAALLDGMAKHLAGLQSFSVYFRAGYDVVQPNGQKIEFGETRRVQLGRPDRLRVEEVASDGTRDLAVFDGRSITVLDADAGVYAQAPQPATLDDALGYFLRELRMRMPLALLLATRLPAVLAERVKSIDYVERTEILGVTTHHVAGRGENVDFQFWITDGARPLPLRVVITYRDSPGLPQFWASFLDWNTQPQFAKDTFQFTPPPGAKPVAFAVQVLSPAATQERPGMNGDLQP